MKEPSLQPIPTPWPQRWQDMRLRLLPLVVFGGACLALSLLWRQQVGAPTLVGQAEPVLANVSSLKPGVLAQLNVVRFQKVQAGEPIGQLMVAEPRLLESSLAVIRAEIELLRVDLLPIAAQQRNALDYNQLRLDWMKQRAQLASAQVNLQLAETERHRTEALFKDQIVAQRVLEQAQAAHQSLQREVAELTSLVNECEASFKTLQPTNGLELCHVTDEPLKAAIAVQESKLHLVEAELSPITLRAPIEGTVAAILHRSGEAITAGQPIVAIATSRPVRIVGYLRTPLAQEPKAGAAVQIRTRSFHRQVGSAHIVEVGSQLETIPPVLLGPVKLAEAELGLPMDVSLPPNLKLRAGELVDIVLSPQPN